jgi:hypothetical protein
VAYGDDNVVSANLSTAGFVPTLWMDEIMAAHKKNVVLAALVRKLNVKGKKGDTVKLPKPTRGSASAKSADTIVTTQTAAGSSISVSLTAHFEYSRLIEDIAEVHALASMRKFYTDDAGYSLAVAKDTSIFNAARTLNSARRPGPAASSLVTAPRRSWTRLARPTRPRSPTPAFGA